MTIVLLHAITTTQLPQKTNYTYYNIHNFNSPTSWFFVDTRLCEILVGPNFEQNQIIKE